jgi:hypothetical protein
MDAKCSIEWGEDLRLFFAIFAIFCGYSFFGYFDCILGLSIPRIGSCRLLDRPDKTGLLGSQS